jgi:hypothetical protein
MADRKEKFRTGAQLDRKYKLVACRDSCPACPLPKRFLAEPTLLKERFVEERRALLRSWISRSADHPSELLTRPPARRDGTIRTRIGQDSDSMA